MGGVEPGADFAQGGGRQEIGNVARAGKRAGQLQEVVWALARRALPGKMGNVSPHMVKTVPQPPWRGSKTQGAYQNPGQGSEAELVISGGQPGADAPVKLRVTGQDGVFMLGPQLPGRGGQGVRPGSLARYFCCRMANWAWGGSIKVFGHVVSPVITGRGL